MRKYMGTTGTSDARSMAVLVGPIPTKPGDRAAAQAYVERICRALDHEVLSTPERRALYKQKARWKKRASGADARWMKVGITAGRPAAAREMEQERDENGLLPDDANEPLLKLIEAKYGRR